MGLLPMRVILRTLITLCWRVVFQQSYQAGNQSLARHSVHYRGLESEEKPSSCNPRLNQGRQYTTYAEIFPQSKTARRRRTKTPLTVRTGEHLTQL